MEKQGELKLSDFIIETRKVSPTEEERFLDSVRLEAAIRDGTISEEEIVRSTQINFGKTLAEKIAEYEVLVKKDPEDQAARNGLNTRIAMQTARTHYIPTHGNCDLSLTKPSDEERATLDDKEQAVKDIVDWCRDKSEIRLDGEPISLDQLVEKMSDKTTDWVVQRVNVEISLDYPDLSHGLAVTFYGPKINDLPNLTFYGNPQNPLKGKTHTTVDLMSALGVLNHFKQKGYDSELELKQNPTEEGNLEVDYIAK